MKNYMSARALSRCRVLVVTTESEDPYVATFQVLDPRRNYVSVANYRSRNKIDTRRITRQYREMYRIPEQLVFEKSTPGSITQEDVGNRIDSLFRQTQIDLHPENKEVDLDADPANSETSELHEPR